MTALAAEDTLNIAHHLPRRARERPWQHALVEPRGVDKDGRRLYTHVTFAQLDRAVDRIAHGLRELGVGRGERSLVLIPPGIELIETIYALFKLGAVPVFVDPGMGRKGFLRAIQAAEPRSVIAIGRAHLALAVAGRRQTKSVVRRVCVGKRPLGFVGGVELAQLEASAPDAPFPLANTRPDELAAILFTSGSTGPAKGVCYAHRMFDAQVALLREVYGLGPDDVDLPGLPIFALFSVALGATTVFPDMDASRPASVEPPRFVQAIRDYGVTYSFGSPTIWGKVARHCVEQGIALPSLRQVFMAGCPVPESAHKDLRQVQGAGGLTHTPYGATEALPIASATGRELEDTFARTREGHGTCVGRPVPGVEVRVIAVTDTPLETWRQVRQLPAGEVGELVVAGPVVTHSYHARPEATAAAKIKDGERIWHRMGDLGYQDAQGRLWFCGRKSQRVETPDGPRYTACVEAVFNQHPQVRRTALVGIGPRGDARPVLVVEALEGVPLGAPADTLAREVLALGEGKRACAGVREILFHPGFPVDVRHNAKIRREVLAVWAAGRRGYRA
ncbi:MAG: fatty acid CoA ligase family protein [Planctomycetota bacterium]